MAFRLNQSTAPFNPNSGMINTRNTAFSGQPQSTTTQQQSPALAAMGQTGAPMTGQLGQPKPVVPAGAAPVTTQAAAVPPRTDLVTPTQVDTSKQEGIYRDQLAQSDKDRETMMTMGYNTISALQRRNASNAALSGFSVGGGSYLAGQRSAAVAGINAFNQGLLNWGSQRQGIMGQQAGLASNAASQNAASANQGSMFNAGREGNIADRKTDAQATQNANQTVASVDQVHADYDYLFNDHNYKGGAGQYNSLLTAYKNSLSTGSAEEQAAAYKALMDFIAPIQHLREKWLSEGGDKQMSFADYYDFWKNK